MPLSWNEIKDRGISGDTALRLGRWFGTGPDIWMNLQKNYELRLVAQAIGEALIKFSRSLLHVGPAE